MDINLRAQWVAALQNGEYAQTDSRLKQSRRTIVGGTMRDGVVTTTITTESQHCCLGVLDECAAKFFEAKGDEKAALFGFEELFHDGDDGWQSQADVKGNTGKLDPDQLDAIGMTSDIQGILISLNDKGASFEAIGAIIPDLFNLQDTKKNAHDRADTAYAETHAARARILELEAKLAATSS